MMKTIPVTVVIVAAGWGSRFGGELPKQFCQLCGRPVLMTTIDRVKEAIPASKVLLVLSAGGMDLWTELCREYKYESPQIIEGGATRWESVGNALRAIEPAEGYVMVHDGARPLLEKAVADRLLESLDAGHSGAIPVVPVSDSLRYVAKDGAVSESVDRARYVAVQTPQAFNVALLKEAYGRPYSPKFTDDASVMEAAGYNDIVLVEGVAATMKITLPRDLKIAELYMKD